MNPSEVAARPLLKIIVTWSTQVLCYPRSETAQRDLESRRLTGSHVYLEKMTIVAAPSFRYLDGSRVVLVRGSF